MEKEQVRKVRREVGKIVIIVEAKGRLGYNQEGVCSILMHLRAK